MERSLNKIVITGSIRYTTVHYIKGERTIRYRAYKENVEDILLDIKELIGTENFVSVDVIFKLWENNYVKELLKKSGLEIRNILYVGCKMHNN